MIKKVFSSRIFRLVLSAVLIYFAFKKVDVKVILKELGQVPIWIIVLNLFYFFGVIILISIRWSLLLFDKINLKKILDFTKANFVGYFYSLVFPTAAVGDLLKWLPLRKAYPDLTKTKLLGSVALDRMIGFTSFSFLAFISVIIGKILKFQLPNYVFWLISLLIFISVVFYIIMFLFDIEKISRRISFLKTHHEIFDFVQKEGKRRMIKAVFVSLITEFIWMMQIFLISKMFGTGFTLISVFVFIPIITLILILPISIAGFGAREYLYVFFFSQLGISDVPILLVSTFAGIIGVLTSLFGGILLLF